MKKSLTLLFLLSFHFAQAGTGSGRDEIFFILSIIAVLLFIFTVLYSIEFVKRMIKGHREKKMARQAKELAGEHSEANTSF